jgi:hypothetical protein
MRYHTVSRSGAGSRSPVAAAISAVARAVLTRGWTHSVVWTAAGGAWHGGNEGWV